MTKTPTKQKASGSQPEGAAELTPEEIAKLSPEEREAMGIGADEETAHETSETAEEREAAEEAQREADAAAARAELEKSSQHDSGSAIRPVRPGLVRPGEDTADEEMVEVLLATEVRIQDPPGTMRVFPAGKTMIPKRLENHWYFRAHREEARNRKIRMGRLPVQGN